MLPPKMFMYPELPQSKGGHENQFIYLINHIYPFYISNLCNIVDGSCNKLLHPGCSYHRLQSVHNQTIVDYSPNPNFNVCGHSDVISADSMCNAVVTLVMP